MTTREELGLRPYPDTPHPLHGLTGAEHAANYFRIAAENPEDHRIPWNCPSYWDGCNCKLDGTFADPFDEAWRLDAD